MALEKKDTDYCMKEFPLLVHEALNKMPNEICVIFKDEEDEKLFSKIAHDINFGSCSKVDGEYETRFTCFDPPTYSVLDNPRDDDKPSPELLANPAYINYCRGVLGGEIASINSNNSVDDKYSSGTNVNKRKRLFLKMDNCKLNK